MSAKSCEKLGIGLKRTVLLSGRYGTGKTLTALLTASIAVQYGWTFIQVLPGDNIDEAFNVAVAHEPAVVFFEDVDSAAGANGQRNERINTILNTLDGMLAKSAKVVTVLTTNHVGEIERAMLRPGRIDKIIDLGKVDAESIVRMIRGYIGDRLSGELDGDKLMSVADGYTPAFVSEACQQALLYSLDRTDGKVNGQMIEEQDIVRALVGLRAQFELMSSSHVVRQDSISSAFESMVKTSVGVALRETGIVSGVRKMAKKYCAGVDDEG